MRLTLALTVISALTLTAAATTAIDWSLYHKTDEILDFFKRAAAKRPAVVRCASLRTIVVAGSTTLAACEESSKHFA